MSARPVAIVGGTGRQGRGIAQRLARAGAPVIVASRDPDRAATMTRNWSTPPVRCASYADAIAAAGTVVLTVPFHTLADLLAQHRAAFTAGALVVDVSVPLVFAAGPVRLGEVAEGSAAEFVKARLGDELRVAAAFKTLPSFLLDDVDRPLDCDEFICGDSAAAREGAAALVQMLPGVRAVDVGPLSRARAIEHATLLAVAINQRHKMADARFRVVGL